jgi:hypothetical protein
MAMNRQGTLGLIAATATGIALGLLGASITGLATGGRIARGHEAADPHDTGNMGPLKQFHLYLCAFHIAKQDPAFQVEAHHYCSPVNEEVHQCIIYDSTGRNARILGVEYIISDRLYRRLTDEEKKYYHPHAYEILSGQLTAPDLSREVEKDLMKGLVPTWGKTWHTWPDPKTPLPTGPPLLMWSITKDGQLANDLLADRDRRLGISTLEIRRDRASFGLPVPQIEPPKSVDEVGRQGTGEAVDEPRRK